MTSGRFSWRCCCCSVACLLFLYINPRRHFCRGEERLVTVDSTFLSSCSTKYLKRKVPWVRESLLERYKLPCRVRIEARDRYLKCSSPMRDGSKVTTTLEALLISLMKFASLYYERKSCGRQRAATRNGLVQMIPVKPKVSTTTGPTRKRPSSKRCVAPISKREEVSN